MGVYKGWEARLKLCPPVVGESLGVGNGTQTVFGPVAQANSDGSYFADTNGDGAKNSQDVSVYLNGTKQPASAYSISTGTGQVTFSSPPGNGVQVTIDYSFEVEVGRCQGVTFEVDMGLEAVRVIGRRTPLEIKEGPVEIKGTVDKLFVDNSLVNRVMPTRNSEGLMAGQGEYILDAEVFDATGVRAQAVLQGVKFSTYSREMPQDDFVSESVDFMAVDIRFA